MSRSKPKFEPYQEIMVIKLTQYLIDAGFKMNKRYSVSTDGVVDGIERSSNRHDRTEAQRGLYVRSEDENRTYLRLCDPTGFIITGAGECFGPYKPKPKKVKKTQVASATWSLFDTPKFIVANASMRDGQWQISYNGSDVSDAIRYVAQSTLPRPETIRPDGYQNEMRVHIDTERAEEQFRQSQIEAEQVTESFRRMTLNYLNPFADTLESAARDALIMPPLDADE